MAHPFWEATLAANLIINRPLSMILTVFRNTWWKLIDSDTQWLKVPHGIVCNLKACKWHVITLIPIRLAVLLFSSDYQRSCHRALELLTSPLKHLIRRWNIERDDRTPWHLKMTAMPLIATNWKHKTQTPVMFKIIKWGVTTHNGCACKRANYAFNTLGRAGELTLRRERRWNHADDVPVLKIFQMPYTMLLPLQWHQIKNDESICVATRHIKLFLDGVLQAPIAMIARLHAPYRNNSWHWYHRWDLETYWRSLFHLKF